MKRFTTILALLILPALAARGAETLVLANGDRLSGKLVKIENGTVHFDSPVLGVIAVPAEKATISSGSKPTTAPASPAAKTQTAPHTPPAKKPAAIADAKKPAPSPWKRRLEFGYSNQSGRKDRSDLSLRANFQWKDKHSEFRAQGRYLFGETNDEKSTDNLFGSLRYRRNFAPGSFGNFETRYERDPIKRIDYDLQQSIGAGHRLIENKKMQLSLGAGGAAIFRSTQTTEPGWTYALDAFQDFNYEINGRFTFNQDFTMLAKPMENNELSIKLKAALIGTITNSINMTMRYELDYDNSLLPDARTSERWITSIAYVF